MPSILITGSNRGLGLELTRQYAEDGWRVYATCRYPAEAVELHALADRHDGVSIHRLDVTSQQEVHAMRAELGDASLDILYNNAGVFLEADYDSPALGGIRYEDWLRTFDVNTLGAVRLTEALADHVARSDKRLVVAMTSHMGSIADIDAPGSYYYRSSKAALNAAMKGLAAALSDQAVGVLLLHPGAVRTRMGPPGGISPEESVRGLRQVIEAFDPANTGAFYKYDGTKMPW